MWMWAQNSLHLVCTYFMISAGQPSHSSAETIVTALLEHRWDLQNQHSHNRYKGKTLVSQQACCKADKDFAPAEMIPYAGR